MELVDLVSDLLFKHNCVIIPGIGGFVANYSQAEFKNDNRTILPSRKRVAFNQSLIENDGLLVNKLSQQKSISYADAEKEVLSFTQFVRDKVVNNKSFEFKNIGTFYLNKDENLVFVPYEGLNMLCSSYGLVPVKIRPIYKDKTENTAVPESIKIEIPKKEVFEENTFKTERKNIFKKIMPWISTAAVIVFLGFSYQYLSNTEMHKGIFNTPVAQQPKVEQDASLLNFDSQPAQIKEQSIEPANKELEKATPLPEVENEVAVTNETNKKSDVVAEQSKAATSKINNAEHAATKIEDNWLEKWQALQHKTTYHVAVYQTLSAADATLKLNELLGKGYNASIIENNGNTFVSLENFTSSKNAKEYIQYIKRSYIKANIIEINK
jgi:hypothetical protein